MKARIWKYAIDDDVRTFQMPVGARVLSVQAQFGRPCLWVMVDPDAPAIVERRFVIKTTGEKFHADNLEFVGTVQVQNGAIVLHIFEVQS